jgi:hypothetical protein
MNIDVRASRRSPHDANTDGASADSRYPPPEASATRRRKGLDLEQSPAVAFPRKQLRKGLGSIAASYCWCGPSLAERRPGKGFSPEVPNRKQPRMHSMQRSIGPGGSLQLSLPSRLPLRFIHPVRPSFFSSSPAINPETPTLVPARRRALQPFYIPTAAHPAVHPEPTGGSAGRALSRSSVLL